MAEGGYSVGKNYRYRCGEESIYDRWGKEETGPPGALNFALMEIQILYPKTPPKSLHGSQRTFLVEKVTHMAVTAATVKQPRREIRRKQLISPSFASSTSFPRVILQIKFFPAVGDRQFSLINIRSLT